jgi:hypothetical protein
MLLVTRFLRGVIGSRAQTRLFGDSARVRRFVQRLFCGARLITAALKVLFADRELLRIAIGCSATGSFRILAVFHFHRQRGVRAADRVVRGAVARTAASKPANQQRSERAACARAVPIWSIDHCSPPWSRWLVPCTGTVLT